MLRPLLALLALACAAPGLPQDERSLTDAQKAECVAKGGHFSRQGKAQVELCHLPTTDKGKTCTTLSQCESYMCEADMTKLTRAQYRGKAPITGKCTGWTNYGMGCQDLVIDGRYRGRCAD